MTSLRCALAADGWTIRTVRLERPLISVTTWTEADLVVVVSTGRTSAITLLETLARRGYEGPFVLLAAGLTMTLRQRALVQGALDVITLPADSEAIQARVRAAAHLRWSHSAPLAP